MSIIDFNRIPPEQNDIHARLVNWELWQRGGSPGNVHPMFRQYRPRHAEATTPRAVDSLDAVRVQKIMKDIPERQRIALQWFYISRSGPSKICAALGASKQELAAIINQARTMAENLLTRQEACI